jgi:hypothetical protein
MVARSQRQFERLNQRIVQRKSHRLRNVDIAAFESARNGILHLDVVT